VKVLRFEEVECKLYDVFFRVRELHQHKFCGFQEPFIVIERPEYEQLFLSVVPIAPKPTENAGAIIQGMR
jgi:hypothetical protein